jgi:hypothetical protein
MKFEIECICDHINSRYCQYHQELAELQDEITSLRESLSVAVEAMEYYAPSDSYEYDKTQGVNYIWNDRGRRAREALATIKAKGEL